MFVLSVDCPVFARSERLFWKAEMSRPNSDIVSDEDVPEEMQRDPELWSGCISGAMREDRFLQAFADAGLYGVEIASYQSEPWAVVNGIEFRSMTVLAYKGKEGPCDDYREAVVYKGPWKKVIDDDGQTLTRGVRSAVCRKTFEIYTREPYADQFIAVPPLLPVEASDAAPFDCRTNTPRSAAETKQGVTQAEVAPGTSAMPRGSRTCRRSSRTPPSSSPCPSPSGTPPGFFFLSSWLFSRVPAD